MKEMSIVVPVYNKVKNLEISLDSLLAAKNGNIEFLVIDDKSTDGSLDIQETKELEKQLESISVFLMRMIQLIMDFINHYIKRQ